MSKEQINLSDALDLIAQSKADIKDSVEGKGGIIGDDLTEYNTAIDNIKFRSLVMKNNVSLFRYTEPYILNVQQYLDGVKSFPNELSYTVVGENVTVSMTEESDGATSQRFILTPTGYGDTTLTIKDNVGNCEYPVTVDVPRLAFDLYPAGNSGFTRFAVDEDESSEYYGQVVAEWDTSAQAWSLDLTLNTRDGHGVPASAMTQFSYNGDFQDYMNITTSTVPGYINIIRLNITPTECRNGNLTVYLSDGTSSSNLNITFIGGEDPSDEPSEYHIYGASAGRQGVYYKFVSQEDEDVFIRSGNLSWETDHYEASGVTTLKFITPVDKMISTITFENLDNTYRAALLQMGTLGYGTVSEDGNDLIWTRTKDYRADSSDLTIDFTEVMQQFEGATITFDEIIITLEDYISQGE